MDGFVPYQYVSVGKGQDDRRHSHCRGNIRDDEEPKKPTSLSTIFSPRVTGVLAVYEYGRKHHVLLPYIIGDYYLSLKCHMFHVACFSVCTLPPQRGCGKK